jgi:DGQHR domain-containing protein
MNFKYLGFTYNQRPDAAEAPRFCVFRAPVGEILQWAAIHRLDKSHPDAIQREPKRARILGIKRFLEQDPRNTIPAAIVVALNNVQIQPIVGCKFSTSGEPISPEALEGLTQIAIDVPEGVKPTVLPGLVIDGQHRLKGIAEFSLNTSINVVAILDTDDNEQAFQFLVINNKAAKVSTDHIRAMVGLNYKEPELTSRLRTARLNLDENVGSVGVMDTDPESPFKGLIKWPHNVTYEEEKATQGGHIPPAAIEAAIGYIKSKRIGDLDDPESVDQFFISTWSVVKEEWAHIFNRQSKLLDKVGIICLTEFMTNQLRSASLNKKSKFSMANPEEVMVNTKELLETLEPDFWRVEWKSTSYDTRAGRDQIVSALDTIHGNLGEERPWHTDVDMIASSEVPA